MEAGGLEFGDIRVDLRLQTVTRAGEPVALEPKTYEVLQYLLAHRERLVTKEELLDTVWKDVFVTPNVLTRAIAQLRRGLGDDAHEPSYIETVARRGYRFVATVTEVGRPGLAPGPAPGPPRRKIPGWAVAAAVVALAAATGWLAVRSRAADAPAPAFSLSRLTSSGDVIDAALSPDGRYVAYVRSAAGLQSLWVRQVGQANPVEVLPPAVVGFWGLAFSPDSASLYYGIKGASPHADPAGTLYAVPVLPGPPPMPVLHGIDSTITFAPDGRRLAFYRVAAGGASHLVVASRDGRDERVLATRTVPKLFAPRFFAAPAWSPDGSRIAVAVEDDTTRTTDLLLVAVDDGAETTVRRGLAGASFLAWLPDGSGLVFTGSPEAAFATGGAQIWVQPIDGGEPRRVTADTMEYRNASVAADGASMVAVGTDYRASLWRITPGEGTASRLPSMRGDGLGGMTWLGGRLFFTSLESGTPQIWSMAADGSDRRQVTAEGWSAWPCASPDGRTLYVIGARGETTAVWHLDPEGGTAREVAAVDNADSLAMSPDGRWLYFTGESGSEESTWRVPAGGGTPQLVVRGLGDGAVSPDGRRLAGMWRQSPREPYTLAVFDAETGARQVDFPGFYSTGLGKAVLWAPDGESLLLVTTERMNVWRQPLSGGPLQKVTGFEDDAIFAVAPDADGRGLILARGPSIRDAFLLTGWSR